MERADESIRKKDSARRKCSEQIGSGVEWRRTEEGSGWWTWMGGWWCLCNDVSMMCNVVRGWETNFSTPIPSPSRIFSGSGSNHHPHRGNLKGKPVNEKEATWDREFGRCSLFQ